METYLVHHGILGQKWGVRRFQNEDGSLTEAGRKRYGVDFRREEVEKANKKTAKRATKMLNDYEKAIARNKALLRSANSTVVSPRGINVSAADPSRKEHYQAQIEKGQREVSRIIKRLEDLGFNVNTKDKLYNTSSAYYTKGFNAYRRYYAGAAYRIATKQHDSGYKHKVKYRRHNNG